MSFDFSAYLRGVQLSSLRRYAEAEAVFGQLLSDDPENSDVLLHLAIAQLHQDGKEKQSLKTIQMALASDPEDSKLHGFHSNILLTLDKYKDALSAAEKAISLDPDSAFAFRMKASALMALGRHAEAEATARQSLELDPDDSGAATILSHALRIQGKAAENEDQIASMLARDPEDDDNHTAAGWQALQKGNRQAAEQHFLEALRLNPENELAREGLLESFKARSPFYRSYLKWTFWMASQSQARQWAIVIGFLLLSKGFRMMKGTEYATIGKIGMGIYWLFVLWVHVASGVGNFFVLLDRKARHALKKREKHEAIFVGGGVVGGLALLAIALGAYWLAPIGLAIVWAISVFLGSTLIVAAFPFAHTFTNDSSIGKWIMGTCGTFVLFSGAMLCVSVITRIKPLKEFSLMLILPAIVAASLCTLLSNFRFFKR